MRDRILITGPGGRIGPHILPLLRHEFALRLLDRQPLGCADAEDEVVLGDIGDLAVFRAACKGVRALVHLAAISDEDDFHSRLLPVNLAGAYHAFEAARLEGVPKVVFASTGQTVLGYPANESVTPDMPARPSTVYACTKLFGEALARYYSDQHGLSAICIRICWFQPSQSPLLRSQPDMRSKWCSPADLANLVIRALRSPLKFGVFFGISNNRGRTWSVENADSLLGFAPADRAEDHAEDGRGRASGP